MTEMSRRIVLAGFAAVAGSAAVSIPAFAQTCQPATPSAEALMAASQDVSKFANARFRARLTITTKSAGPRVRDLTGVSKTLDAGQSTARMMRIAGPADMKGVATLTIDRKQTADDLWIYLPSLRRVRRLVASNRRDPWMGSDFSYGDIVGHEVADWSHRILRRESLGEVACTVIVSTPARDAVASETGYSRRITWLRDGDAFAVRADFFDLAGSFLKAMEATGIQLLDKAGGKSQAMHIAMRTAKSESILAFDEFRIDATVPESEVAPESLKQ